MNLIKIRPSEINKTSFELIGKDWMLITAKKGEKVNTMTASWGGFGVMWNKDVAYIVLRPQRYTKEFIDNSETFSLTFFDETYKKQLGYLGSVSGREENKIEKSGLTLCDINGMPTFNEAKLIINCRKLLKNEFLPENFYDKELMETNYPNKDYHTLYIGEIIEVYENKKEN